MLSYPECLLSRVRFRRHSFVLVPNGVEPSSQRSGTWLATKRTNRSKFINVGLTIANADVSLEEWRDLIEQWPIVAAEPGEVEYVEAIVEAGIGRGTFCRRLAMAKFMFIFRGGAVEFPDLSPTEMQAHLNKWYAWAGALAQAGRHNGGQPLDRRGRTLRGRDRVVTDGPYAESKDLVTGSLVIEASSLDEAVDLARDCPVFECGGSLEVRPVLEHET